jgi:D-glycero-D-manno-heptose 1,7-bisphosphate phosphatase
MDRDGVLNELVLRDGSYTSPRRVEDFRVPKGVPAAVSRLRNAGFAVFVATNQPDVRRGLMTAAELDRMTEMLRSVVEVDDIRVCIHDDRDECSCRKPAPGMLLELANRWQIDLTHSYMIGDSWRDVEAGRRAGCRTIHLLGNEDEHSEADHRVRSLAEAAAIVLDQCLMPTNGDR